MSEINYQKHFAVALIDQKQQMFIESEETGQHQFIHKIPEHLTRLLELSENQHIFMDYAVFVALGKTSIPNRFCRIFCDNQQQVAEVGISKYWRVHLKSQFQQQVRMSTYYNPKLVIFFMGQRDFLDESFQYCRKLLLTVVNAKIEIPTKHYHNDFNIENAKYYFSKRKDIIPEMMTVIKEYKNLQQKQLSQSAERFEIAENGMKVYKSDEQLKKEVATKYDAIFDSPDYMFYEFSN
jgi:hypothetical protein